MARRVFGVGRPNRVREPAVGVRGVVRGLRGDDERVMALADQVLRHAHYAVCDAINVRREGLRNDRDPHVFKIAREVFEISHGAVTCKRTIHDN
jgi:hypothetical protein